VVLENLSLLIKPAGPDCNARCRYCFYNVTREHLGAGKHRMSDTVLAALTEKLLKLRLPVTTFCWQGGEPTLMGLGFFQRAVKLQKKLGKPGQMVANALQTNALSIDDAWAQFLARYRFLVGVSLDGPRQIHDANRGQGTHERVMAAIRTLAKHRVQYNILTVVSKVNEDRGEEVYRWLREQGFRFLQFIPAVETDRQGQALPFAVSPEGYGKFMCQVFDAWLAEGGPGKVYVRFFESLVSHLAGEPAANCTLGTRCDTYLVVEHNGDVYPCDFFVRPELRIGNILESDLPQLAMSRARHLFADAKFHLPDECYRCRYLSICNGGCLKDRQRAHGTFKAPSYLCPSYKLFYEHALPWFNRAAEMVRSTRAAGPDRSAGHQPLGRNDPCPCGSGRKFKKCCGAEGNSSLRRPVPRYGNNPVPSPRIKQPRPGLPRPAPQRGLQ